MGTLWRDLQFGVRTLWRSPLSAGLALVILALGIGANSAIFSVISGVLLSPLPYPHPEQLVQVTDSAPRLGMPRFASSPANYSDWRAENRSFATLDAYDVDTRHLSLAEGERTVAVAGALVSGGFFRTLEEAPRLGRLFRPEDDWPGAEPVAVVSYELWRSAFGGDPGLIGRRVEIEGRARTVVGIARPGLAYPHGAAVWLPLALDYAQMNRGAHDLTVVGRLRPGVSAARAQQDVSAIAARLARLYPETNAAWGVLVEPLRDRVVADVKPALVLLGRAVWVVLLIACVNVANLLLARLTTRGRELATRAALGAGRGRIVRQVVVESMLLFAAGGALGLGLAWAGTRALLALSPGVLPRAETVGIDGTVLLYTLGVSMAAGLLVGLVPALSAAAGRQLHGALKDGGRSVAGSRTLRTLRQGLVAGEVALALALLVAAGLLLRSFVRLAGVSPGFEPRGVMTAVLSLPAARYPDAQRQAEFSAQLVARAGALPGVEQAATVSPLPLAGERFLEEFAAADRPAPAPEETPSAHVAAISPDYFRALGIPVIAGRAFTADDRIGSQRVVIVNRRMASRIWPGDSPLGKRITFDSTSDPKARWWTVVGMADNTLSAELRRQPEMQAYWPQSQRPRRELALVLRTGGPPARLVPGLRQLMRALDPDLSLDRVQTLDAVVAGSLSRSRLQTVLIGLFGLLALALAAAGIYGVVSYTVAQRTHEIGIRVALGAGSRQVIGMVLAQGMSVVAGGLAVGLAAAWVAARLVSDELFQITASDPPTYIAVALILAAVAAFANWVPARRATAVDPLEALRAE
jgi:predicted permease